jgi:hypothetical protein
MNFVPLSEFLIIMGQFGWVGIHGVPPFIYLVSYDLQTFNFF